MSKYKLYCPEHYEEIENYDLALKDNFVGWVCHHRNGEDFGVEWLKENNMYYNRKDPKEFKFMRKSEHRSLHLKLLRHNADFNEKMVNSLKGRTLPEEIKKKISLSRKGFNGKVTTDFGTLFKEHYGIRCSDNRTLYKREWKYFKKYGVCRWLNEQ